MTGVQTCALPIYRHGEVRNRQVGDREVGDRHGEVRNRQVGDGHGHVDRQVGDRHVDGQIWHWRCLG